MPDNEGIQIIKQNVALSTVIFWKAVDCFDKIAKVTRGFKLLIKIGSMYIFGKTYQQNKA